MNLKSPKFSTPDPFEKFILTLMVAVDIVILSVVFSQFPTQSLSESLNDLYAIGLTMLLQACIILVAHYEHPRMDD
jgi:hypothetical protein